MGFIVLNLKLRLAGIFYAPLVSKYKNSYTIRERF